MRPLIKYLLGLWILLSAGLGFLLYNAYSKLKPEMFISLLSEQVQRNYPGTNLEVGKVDYRLSIDFNMGLKNIILRRGDKIIGKLGEIELRLPWWLLLFQKGNAQINLNDLTVYIDESQVKGSPANAEEVGVDKSEKKDIADTGKVTVSIPDYLANAQFTLRAKDVSVLDIKNSRRYFSLNKLLVREFQFGKNSAFELNLPVSINYHDRTYKSELWLFGDLTPSQEEWDLKFRGEFRTRDLGENIQFEDLIIDGKAKFNSQLLNIISNLTFLIDKEEIGTGEFKASDKQFLLQLKLQSFPLTFLTLFENEIKNPYLSELSSRAEGEIKISKRYERGPIKLDGFLTFPGHINLAKDADQEITGKWRISFNDAKWETSFMSPKGRVSFFRRSVIDFQKEEVAQYVEELGFTDIDLTAAIQRVLPLEHIIMADAKDYSSSTVSFKRCLLGDRQVDGTFRYGISPDQKFYVAELKDGKSAFKLNFHQSSLHKKLDVNFDKFSWIPQYVFLAPHFSATAGILSGKLEGRWNEEVLLGQWLAQLEASGLQAPSGTWFDFTTAFWAQFGLDPSVVPDQDWKFNLKNELLKLESLVLEGPDPAKISGQVDLQQKKKSFLVLTYPKNRKWKAVKKEVQGAFWKRNEND